MTFSRYNLVFLTRRSKFEKLSTFFVSKTLSCFKMYQGNFSNPPKRAHSQFFHLKSQQFESKPSTFITFFIQFSLLIVPRTRRTFNNLCTRHNFFSSLFCLFYDTKIWRNALPLSTHHKFILFGFISFLDERFIRNHFIPQTEAQYLLRNEQKIQNRRKTNSNASRSPKLRFTRFNKDNGFDCKISSFSCSRDLTKRSDKSKQISEERNFVPGKKSKNLQDKTKCVSIPVKIPS